MHNSLATGKRDPRISSWCRNAGVFERRKTKEPWWNLRGMDEIKNQQQSHPYLIRGERLVIMKNTQNNAKRTWPTATIVLTNRFVNNSIGVLLLSFFFYRPGFRSAFRTHDVQCFLVSGLRDTINILLTLFAWFALAFFFSVNLWTVCKSTGEKLVSHLAAQTR